jgi:hypothetical protein
MLLLSLSLSDCLCTVLLVHLTDSLVGLQIIILPCDARLVDSTLTLVKRLSLDAIATIDAIHACCSPSSVAAEISNKTSDVPNPSIHRPLYQPNINNPHNHALLLLEQTETHTYRTKMPKV